MTPSEPRRLPDPLGDCRLGERRLVDLMQLLSQWAGRRPNRRVAIRVRPAVELSADRPAAAMDVGAGRVDWLHPPAAGAIDIEPTSIDQSGPSSKRDSTLASSAPRLCFHCFGSIRPGAAPFRLPLTRAQLLNSGTQRRRASREYCRRSGFLGRAFELRSRAGRRF
jgi:hypothetical protein